ncbi:hypothetical protein IW261DRAFT_1511447 [Armillaria novae-zelandiae]|uniref:Uncharacterized protein n=1 Tax=Armillaria novae-zelandiae TaxID=153914 RepID=A0AA39NTK5_9AGAR|nr:hypothetical protein IW261DRAFT_1511447 [Armillaria novae-zelandiae]
MSCKYEDLVSEVPCSLWSMLAPAGGAIVLSCFAWYGYRHFAFTLEENRKERSVLRSALAQRDAEVLSLRKTLSEPTQQKVATPPTAPTPTQPLRKDSAEVQTLRRRLSDLNRELGEFRAHNRALTLDVQAGREELRDLGIKLQQSDKLSKARAGELQVAQTYLSTADQFSGVEIIQAVEALNEEISGTAATLADIYEQAKRTTDKPAADIPYRHVADILGDTMARFIKSNPQYEVLQVAFSAAICAHAGAMVMSWCLRRDPEKEEGWNEVYDRIRQSEKQAIAGKWRALTQKAIEPPFEHDEADIQTVLGETLANILTIAGFDLGDNKLAETLVGSGIAKKLVELRFCARQGVTSCEMEPVYVAPGLLFNSEAMEDALSRGDLERQDGEMQICSTTELGLVAIEGWGLEESETSLKILKKARVVLLSGLNDIVA